MSPSKKSLQILSVVLVLIAIVVFSFILPKLRNDKTEETTSEISDSTSQERGKDNTIRVSAQAAEIKDLIIRISSTGLTKALKEITVCPKVSGQVSELSIKNGDFVKQGALLAMLDDKEYNLAMLEAKDQLLGAQAVYGFQKRDYKSNPHLLESNSSNIQMSSNADKEMQLADKVFNEAKVKYEKGELSDVEFSKEKFEYETAQIINGQRQDELRRQKSGLTRAYLAMQKAELNFANTKIFAPFSGYVGDLEIEGGQQISAGKECFKLLDLSKIDVNLQVLESEIGWIKLGRKAEITLPAYSGEVFYGQVVSINPMVDPERKTTTVTVRIPNTNNKILPGMFAYAKLEAQILQDKFLVPKESILIRDQRKLLFIVRDGLAKWSYVTPGLENEEYSEVVESTLGLKPGELVIIEGHYTLVHDAKVKVE
jgi:membrane fusion protein, multidrug efflux system